MAQMNKNTVEIFADIRRETSMAWLVDDGAVQAWLPKSQVDLGDVNQYRQGTFLVPEWLANEKGLI